MAYEYEDKLYANSVIHLIAENTFVETGETKEIKEVYRKAKAFDEILNITQLQHEEEYADDVISVIDKYKEDK
ncbi:DUF1024 family protein [Staphylococcus shinii]|uniref:DUF1024 family protein n=1 Tax=Staphylococcus shinii TaxID=2912228 RepID=UPI003CEBC277